MPAVSRLISTPFRGGDISSKARVGRSADAAGTSACATSHKKPVDHFIDASVVSAAEVGTLALALLSLAVALRFPRLAARRFVIAGETPLFVAADAPVGVQPFQDELRGGGPHRIRLVLAHAQRLRLLHQPLNRAQLPHHRGRIHRLDRKSTLLNSSHLGISY